MTKVVHVHRAPFDVYIGRRFGEFLRDSYYHNPYHAGDRPREDVIIDFAIYWFSPAQKHLRDLAVQLLPGKTLGCWCDDPPNRIWCHGHIIAGYVDSKIGMEQKVPEVL